MSQHVCQHAALCHTMTSHKKHWPIIHTIFCMCTKKVKTVREKERLIQRCIGEGGGGAFPLWSRLRYVIATPMEPPGITVVLLPPPPELNSKCSTGEGSQTPNAWDTNTLPSTSASHAKSPHPPPPYISVFAG